MAAGIISALISLDYYDVRIAPEITIGFFGIWIGCFLCDAAYTVRNKRMICYESNVVFAPLYARLGLCAVPIQALVDLGFVALIMVVVTGSIHAGHAGVIAAIFGLLHFGAFYSNRKFVRNFTQDRNRM